MLRIALPNKGSLSEKAITLVGEAGYQCLRTGRELMVTDNDNEIEFVFLRPRDIAVYVSSGIFDLGITGRDLFLDSERKVHELLPLGFGGSTFRYAIAKDKDLTPAQFGGLRIATSYPNIVKQDMARRGLDVKIVTLDGAVEISVRLGVADAIADVVSSGRTLVEAGLKVVGEPILKSEAVVIANDPAIAESSLVKTFLDRLQGIVVARDYVMIEYDVPRSELKQACTITPGIESPTVAPLNDPAWVAVKAMTRRKGINGIMDDLAALGAKGIMVTDIRTCRL
jgi:ATP phosphoribosyltransferase